jgi:methionine sulfoxide reductase heme-binding subunit
MLLGNVSSVMEHTMTAITGSTALWYASRATGVVSLLLLSLVVMLGILVNRQGRLPGLPAFAVTGLHRSLSLLAVLFIAVHVATAVIDPYVSIGLAAVVIPFVSAYQPFWLGLGAVALDLIAALVVTSLMRARISRRFWRGIHWLAYAAWPVALAHGFGSSPDLRSGGLLALAIGCALAVGAAGLWRLAGTIRQVPRARRPAVTLGGARPGGLARQARAGEGGAR